MKKIVVLVLCLLVTTSVFAFDTGEKLVWADASFTSYKPDKDIDATTTFNIDTAVSYFLMKDISLDVILAWQSQKSPYWYMKDGTQTTSDIFLGLGGSFFVKSFYVHGAFLYNLYSSKTEMKSDDTWTSNAMYLTLGGGYLFPLIENVFIDIGANYTMGLGEYSGDAEGDNTESQFGVGAGFVVNLP